MPIKAAVKEIDITPKLGTVKAGSLRRIIAEEVRDPLYARILLLESGGVKIGFVSLDLLSIRSEEVSRIRALAEPLGIPSDNLMIAATHNHAGPATTNVGDSERDDDYVEFLVESVSSGIRSALSEMVPARVGIATCTEGRISFNRRYIMKDGSVKCHPPIASPEIRCAEGVIDPEVGVVCVKDEADKVLGFIVNFACHPTHHCSDGVISAGFPGQMALALKEEFGGGCVPLFLNGAFGNIHTTNPYDPEYVPDMTKIGRTLADDVRKLVPKMVFRDSLSLGARRRMVKLPLRDIDGAYGIAAKYPQRFGGEDCDRIYEEAIQKLREKKAKCDYELAEAQCLKMDGDIVFVGIPAEYFVEHGLRIKIESPVRNTFVIGAANGMVGYVPTVKAFERGGYETTISMWSKLAPEAGDMLTDAAIQLIQDAI